MKLWFAAIVAVSLLSCNTHQTDQKVRKGQKSPEIRFRTLDTDFSKGRLAHEQTITLQDLEKFHGHLCDGLVVGALAMQEAIKALYPTQAIDRTNLRIMSKPSPCLTDVAIFLTGGRYQFNTFYVDTAFKGLYIIQRIDNLEAVSVSLNKGIKPAPIDSLGSLAVEGKLSPCGLDSLKKMESDFSAYLLNAEPAKLFTVEEAPNFEWKPKTKHDYTKTDVLNKDIRPCN